MTTHERETARALLHYAEYRRVYRRRSLIVQALVLLVIVLVFSC